VRRQFERRGLFRGLLYELFERFAFRPSLDNASLPQVIGVGLELQKSHCSKVIKLELEMLHLGPAFHLLCAHPVRHPLTMDYIGGYSSAGQQRRAFP
jgi:hypothetical protein